MDPAIKHKISQRALSLRMLAEYLNQNRDRLQEMEKPVMLSQWCHVHQVFRMGNVAGCSLKGFMLIVLKFVISRALILKCWSGAAASFPIDLTSSNTFLSPINKKHYMTYSSNTSEAFPQCIRRWQDPSIGQDEQRHRRLCVESSCQQCFLTKITYATQKR